MELKTVMPGGGFYEEDDNVEELPYKGMRKMTASQEKKFPLIAADSLICQSRYIAIFERCAGCSFAIKGCEKVVEMSAG